MYFIGEATTMSYTRQQCALRTNYYKGKPYHSDLRYGQEYSISPSTLICDAIKSQLGIYTLLNPPEVLWKFEMKLKSVC